MKHWFLERSRAIQWAVSIGIAVLMGFFVWKPALSGGFSLRDDHDIVVTVGSDNDLGIAEAFSSLADTELANYGSTVRFRPTYWVARRLECAAWENEAAQWRWVRFLAAMSFAGVVTFFLLTYFSLPVAVLAAGIILTGTYWFDIFATLGTSEFYGVIGITGVLLGYLVAGRHFRIGLALAFAGVFFAIGVKENFLVAPLFLIPFHFVAGGRTHRLMLWGAILSSLAWAFFVLFGFLPQVLAGERDLYGKSIWLSERLEKFLSPMLIAGIASFLIYLVFELKQKAGRFPWDLMARPGLVIHIILVVVMLFNVVYYGELPTKIRYAFPSLAIAFAMIALTLDRFVKGLPERLRLIVIPILVLVAMVPITRQLEKLRKATSGEVMVNAASDAFIEKIATECLNRQLTPVIVIDGREIISHQYEYAHAFAAYLSARMGAEDGVAVAFEFVDKVPVEGFERDLFEGLRGKVAKMTYFHAFNPTADPASHFAVLVFGSARSEYAGALTWNVFAKQHMRQLRKNRRR